MSGPDAEALRAAIGPRSGYYLRQLDKIEQGEGKWVATWSWPAFFLSSAWFAYRRMGGYSVLNFLLPFPFIALLPAQGGGGVLALVLLGSYLAIAFIAIPMYANALYYRRLKTLIARASASAGETGAKKRLRPPSAVTGIGAALAAGLAFLVPMFFFAVRILYVDYTPRAVVSEGVSLGASLKSPITDFYEEHKRLPASHEAGRFRVDGGKYTQSVIYDADRQMIVITLGNRFQGKRIAFHAVEKDGTIFWNCRTIVLEQQHLPPPCRDP